MDWRNHKFRRKKLFGLDETSTEFDLLVQRTIKGIALRKRIRANIQLFERTPTNTQKVSWWELNLETLTIYEKIFSFRKNFDKKLVDPVWETVSLKIKKYLPFLNINVFQYKQILKGLIDE